MTKEPKIYLSKQTQIRWILEDRASRDGERHLDLDQFGDEEDMTLGEALQLMKSGEKSEDVQEFVDCARKWSEDLSELTGSLEVLLALLGYEATDDICEQALDVVQKRWPKQFGKLVEVMKVTENISFDDAKSDAITAVVEIASGVTSIAMDRTHFMSIPYSKFPVIVGGHIERYTRMLWADYYRKYPKKRSMYVENGKEYYLLSDLADGFDVSVSLIRKLEIGGFIAPFRRSKNGLRLIPKDDFERRKREVHDQLQPVGFVKPSEYCEFYGINPTKLMRMRKRGEVNFKKVRNRYFYVL